jgi:hypothetical protein
MNTFEQAEAIGAGCIVRVVQALAWSHAFRYASPQDQEAATQALISLVAEQLTELSTTKEVDALS